MKLRTKIFISILIVSLATLSISSFYLINRNHLDNITREQQRSVHEFDFLQATLENGLDFTLGDTDTLQLLLSRYAQYYAGRGIILMVYREGKPVYSDFSDVSQKNFQSLLSVPKGSKLAQVIEEKGKHFFFVTGRTSEADDMVLVYARDISGIYQSRTQSIYLTILLATFLIGLLSLLSFLFSRWITRPIEVLHQGANAVSQGDYSARIPDTKDEFNDLGTAFNHMASAVEARTQELERKAKELQTFIDDLSHEMNTPLTSIQGYSEFLMSANASEEQKQKSAAVIKQEAKRMKDIYTKLMALTFAREHDLEPVLIDIKELFEEIKDTFSPLLAGQNIECIVRNEIKDIRADRALLHMLLSNLVKNSIQALPQGGIIHMNAYLYDNNPVLEVSDNGHGIPEDKITEVTKPFFRVDKSRSRKTGGAGLGLSICKSIADLHHAEFIIESKEGTGTSIKLRFMEKV